MSVHYAKQSMQALSISYLSIYVMYSLRSQLSSTMMMMMILCTRKKLPKLAVAADEFKGRLRGCRRREVWKHCRAELCMPPTVHSLSQLPTPTSNAAIIWQKYNEIKTFATFSVQSIERQRERQTMACWIYPFEAKTGTRMKHAARTEVIPAAVPSIVFSE